MALPLTGSGPPVAQASSTRAWRLTGLAAPSYPAGEASCWWCRTAERPETTVRPVKAKLSRRTPGLSPIGASEVIQAGPPRRAALRALSVWSYSVSPAPSSKR